MLQYQKIDVSEWIDVNKIKSASKEYEQNKGATKEKSRERYQNLSQKEKDRIKEYQRKKFQELVQYEKEVLKNK